MMVDGKENCVVEKLVIVLAALKVGSTVFEAVETMVVR